MSHQRGNHHGHFNARGGGQAGANNGAGAAGGGGGGSGQQDEQQYFEEHQLHASWVLWEHAKVRGKAQYTNKNALKLLSEFATVEDFWRVWSFLPRISEVSKLQGLDAFSVFKKGINPKWEDPKNTKGGQLVWEMRIDEKNDTLIDVIWEDLVIACLGQILEDGNDDICGIRAVDRSDRPTGKFYRLELWMDGNTTDANVDKIKARLLEAVDGDRFAVKPDFRFSRRPT